MKVIYFTSQFPAQTHAFLWREYQALSELGLNVKIVCTRKTVKKIQPHEWTEEAEKKTFYLLPFSPNEILYIIKKFILIPKEKKKNLIKIFRNAEDLNFIEKAKLIPHLITAIKLDSYVKKWEIKHIHCTTCASTANIALFSKVLFDTNYSLSLLGPKLETYGGNQAQKWYYASFGLFQSEKLIKETKEKIASSLPELYTFAPVGVNTEVIKRSSPYTPFISGTCRLYSCGRLHPIKGHIFLLKALLILRKKGISASLRIGGEDIDGGSGYRKVLEKFILDNSLEREVKLLGAVSETENIKEYNDCHIYVMGSLDEAAGAVAAMEAMSMEIPVIMPNVGSTAELIENKKDGILIKHSSEKDIADKIEYLMKEPLLCEKIGKRGRKKIIEKFSHRISAKVIYDFIKKTQST